MRAISVGLPAIVVLGTAFVVTPARADNAIMEQRDTQGMSNDWNSWKYRSQGYAARGRHFCNVSNCVNLLEEGADPGAGRH